MRVLLESACLVRSNAIFRDTMFLPFQRRAGVKNGALLRLVGPDFDVFMTIDGNLRYQQNLAGLQLAFVVLTAVNNKLETLQPLIPQVLNALLTIQLGQIVKVIA